MANDGQEGYPALAKAQRLNAERLGARGDIPHPQLIQRRFERVQSRPVSVERVRQPRHSRGGPKVCQQRDASNRMGITNLLRSSTPGHVSPSKLAAARDRSRSPLPPRHEDQVAGSSLDKTILDIKQIVRGVRGEAAALDRFLSFEIVPAAQQTIDAAVAEHSKACDLSNVLRDAPPTSIDDGRGEQGRSSSRALQILNGNSTNQDTRAASVLAAGGGASGAEAGAADDSNETRNLAAAKTFTSDASTSSDASMEDDFSGDGVVAVKMKEERVRGINGSMIRAIVPPAFSDRANLPPRRFQSTKSGGSPVCPPKVNSIGPGGDGNGSTSDDARARWSPARWRSSTQAAVGMTERYDMHVEVEQIPQSRRQRAKNAENAGQSRVGDTGRESDRSGQNDDSSNEEYEEDDRWNWWLSRGTLATDISSKLVGVSSIIRRKVAEAENGVSRNS